MNQKFCIIALFVSTLFVGVFQSVQASECLWYNTSNDVIARGTCDSGVNNADGSGTLGNAYLVWTQCDTGLCSAIETQRAIDKTYKTLENLKQVLLSDNDEDVQKVVEEAGSLLVMLNDQGLDRSTARRLKWSVKKALKIVQQEKLTKNDLTMQTKEI